jgi:NAD-dependent SIR2 family protein deacetylase
MNITAPLQQKLIEAARLINKSHHLVVFTGAGISTESGIPDYRGPEGVWTLRAQGKKPKFVTSWEKVKPNDGHYALVELQNMGLMKFLISQNVDNLHLASGIQPSIIAEFHGNRTLMRCLSCDTLFPKKGLWNEKKWGNGYRTDRVIPGQPGCPNCGGRIISSIVNFGDPIPEKEFRLSITNSQKADVLCTIGSSLTVTPAVLMPQKAKANGAKLIIINKQRTGLDHQADIRFFEGAGMVLTHIVMYIKKMRNGST